MDRHAVTNGIRLAGWCLRETLRVYRTHELGAEPLDPPERFLRRLPASFSTSEAEETAEEVDVPRRTLFKWLRDLQDEGKLKRIHRGRYEKMA